jgi:hypothetical protein
MPLHINRNRLRETHQGSWLILDLFMVVLVLVNLGFIIFDTLYAAEAFRAALQAVVPAFNQFYGERVHPHFLFYDLFFIAIFLAEFAFQWIVAARKQTYARWYFYPFLHWYDLIGSIPIGSLRLLRLLRIISLLVRLQKMGVIDLTGTRPYRFFMFYFNVFIDEVSDRVIVRTLDDLRREVEDDTPIGRKIIDDVIAPQREALIRHASQRIGLIAQRSYQHRQQAIREYVETVISEAVASNDGIRNLARVPVVGKAVVNTLRQSINDIVYQIFDRTMQDLSAAENNRLVDETVTVVIDALLEDHPQLGELGTQLTLEAIELIKERVRVQHWKEALRRQREEQARLA